MHETVRKNISAEMQCWFPFQYDYNHVVFVKDIFLLNCIFLLLSKLLISYASIRFVKYCKAISSLKQNGIFCISTRILFKLHCEKNSSFLVITYFTVKVTLLEQPTYGFDRFFSYSIALMKLVGRKLKKLLMQTGKRQCSY